jgi:hypothetical protein
MKTAVNGGAEEFQSPYPTRKLIFTWSEIDPNECNHLF